LGRGSNYEKIFVPLLIVFGFGIFVVGYFIDIVTFSFEGLAGYMLENSTNSYSLFELGY